MNKNTNFFIHIVRWTDISNDADIFSSPYEFERFVFITEEIKKEIKPFSNPKHERDYVIKRLMDFGIFRLSTKTHILWRFFS